MKEKKDIREMKRKRVCRVCGTRQAVIRKYGLFVCRRCFKEIAEKIGFQKYD
ncbi:MAG: 30S ribosomal protein S14 [Candidatus Diapherotrites archaeon]|uniref:30S ribosomal protein S14 n=1 Tax=Candidatus Iainarchaeum sp. TaxID=3101447 RepID=A0A938YVJ0_9ARCH|nr:30S ribosomal protein S14 [Candidatus Diapherotrites archaeon]